MAEEFLSAKLPEDTERLFRHFSYNMFENVSLTDTEIEFSIMCFYHEEWGELSDYSFKGSFMHAVLRFLGLSFFFSFNG